MTIYTRRRATAATMLWSMVVSYSSSCYFLSSIPTISGWVILPRQQQQQQHLKHERFSFSSSSSSSSSQLSMGILDSISGFLNKREGDFIKLDESEKEYGPGPALILYNVPTGIDNDEIYDMLSDGAPRAFQKGIALARVSSSSKNINNDNSNDDNLLSLSLQQALETVVAKFSATTTQKGSNNNIDSMPLTTDAGLLGSTPVLLFSGFTNREMLDSYNIIGREIYDETAGQASAACAKAVPNAMKKPLLQVFEEISGDHQDAIKDSIPSSAPSPPDQ